MRITVMFLMFVLTGCMSEYEICIDQQRSEFRQRNPGASHSLMTSRQQEFEMMCSRHKQK